MELSVSVKVVLDSYHLSERVLWAGGDEGCEGDKEKEGVKMHDIHPFMISGQTRKSPHSALSEVTDLCIGKHRHPTVSTI